MTDQEFTEENRRHWKYVLPPYLDTCLLLCYMS